MGKTQPDDESEVSFIASVDDMSTMYSLVVQCDAPLTPIEYAECLRSFAHDIESGGFDFEQDGETLSTQ